MTEILGTIATLLAITGVLLNNRRMIACFYVWMVSNLITAGLHCEAGMVSLMVRDVVFFALAIDGAIRWRKHV